MKEDNFLFPREWYLLVTDENRDLVDNWRRVAWDRLELSKVGGYNYITNNGWGLVESDIGDGRVEITTFQFKEHILKEVDMDENGIIEEDLDYLIELFKKLKIK